MRKRVKATRAQRNRLHGWSFARQFTTYKAALKGIPLLPSIATPAGPVGNVGRPERLTGEKTVEAAA
jgi:hypothetical protein